MTRSAVRSGIAPPLPPPPSCPPNPQLKRTGRHQKLKHIAKERLQETGWTSELRSLLREAAFTKLSNSGGFTHRELVGAVMRQARLKVPESIRAQLLLQIKSDIEELNNNSKLK